MVDGYLAGHHGSPQPGEGVELLQFRAYEPGDDLRRVDWRAYARSDRFFVRESEVERDIVVRFVLDATASMGVAEFASGGQRGDAAAGTKLDAARGIVATLGVLADRQGDRVALHVIGDGARGGRAARLGGLSMVFSQLESITAGGRWGDRGLARAGLPPRRRRDLVVVVSDLYQEADEIETDLGRLAAVGHDVVVLHLLHRSEYEFLLPEEGVFRDAETGELRVVSTSGLRAEYLARRDTELAAWQRLCQRRGFTYQRVLSDESMVDWLPRLLQRRRTPSRGGLR